MGGLHGGHQYKKMRNKVQLLTYADRFGGGGLPELRALMAGPLQGVFGGVHVLPFFYPIDGTDAGFDPIDHTRVDDRLGTWADVAALAHDVPVMADVIVNHMSADSPQFQSYVQEGAASAYNGLFLTLGAVFPGGASEADLLAVYRPRPGLPFTAVKLADGQRRMLWNTFTSQQVDIDVQHPQGRAYLTSILQTLADAGVTMVRLDAVGYAIKKAGTSCFMIPETFAFIDAFAAQARALGLEVLVEVHAYYRRQIEIAQRVDRVYDFALPPLLLHALAFKTAGPLMRWIAERPVNAVTVLDTHDGIGIIDIGADAADPLGSPGLVPPQELDQLVEIIHTNSQGQSRAATGAAASNLDLYQVNCTYFDALGRDTVAYLVSRAVQFFVPGVPQIYYVGLLAGHNDMALLGRSGAGRDINRHHYSTTEITQALDQAVVQQLLRLVQLRNDHAAFDGIFTCEQHDLSRLVLRWTSDGQYALLRVDFAGPQATLEWTSPQGLQTWVMHSNPSA
jgi:sucrose phosphorylase